MRSRRSYGLSASVLRSENKLRTLPLTARPKARRSRHSHCDSRNVRSHRQRAAQKGVESAFLKGRKYEEGRIESDAGNAPGVMKLSRIYPLCGPKAAA
jgi:hypothetical protein